MTDLSRRNLLCMGAAAAVAPVLPLPPMDIRLPLPWVGLDLAAGPDATALLVQGIDGKFMVGDVMETWMGRMVITHVGRDGAFDTVNMEPDNG